MEPQLDRARRLLQAAAEGVEDAAIGRPFLLEDADGVVERVTAVDDQGRALVVRQLDHAAEDALLHVARGQVAMEVQAHLAHAEDARVVEHAVERVDEHLVVVVCIVRVQADHAVEEIVARHEFVGGASPLAVEPHVHQRADAVTERVRDGRLAVVVERVQVDMAV